MNEYDEMIKEALEQEEHYADQGTYDEGGKNIAVLYEEEEEEEVEDEDANKEVELKFKSGQGQGNDMSNILDASDSEVDKKDEKDTPKPVKMSIDKSGGNTKKDSSKKKKKLTGLDASDDDDGDSGSDFELSESEESDFDGDESEDDIGKLIISYN